MLRPGMLSVPAFLLLCANALFASPADDYVALRRMIGQERYDEAISTCIDLIREHPDMLALYETLPEVAQYAGNIDRAVTFFETRVEDGTALPLVYYGLGTAFYGKQDYRTAVVYFNNAIEAGNTTAECYRGLEYAYEKLEGIDAATRYFNLLCHRDPKNANNWYGLALAYWTRQDYERVKSCLNEALAQRPGERRFIQAQVAAAYLRGETDSVAGMMNRLIAKAAEDLDFSGKEFLKSFVAVGHFNRDRYPSAMQTIEEIISDGKTYGYLRWLGWGYKRMSDVRFLMGEYQPAIQSSKQAAIVAEKVGDEELLIAALDRQFEVYSEMGDFYNELEAAYEEQFVYPRLGESTECIRPLVDIACALHDVGSDDIALEFAIEALGKSETLKIDSRLPYQIHICLGLIYEGLESYLESVRHFRLAAELVPVDNFWTRNIAVCHGHLGRTLMKLKKYGEAREHLNKQLSIASRAGYDREVCYAEAYMGLLYQAQGKNRLSRELLEKAYELSSRLGQLPSILICARGLSILAESDHRLGAAVLWREKAIATTESMGLWHERLISLGCFDRELLSDYHEYVRLLCAIRRPDKAFEAAERAKSLSFTKLVNIPQVEKNLAGSDPIRARLLSLQQEIINLHCLLASEKAPLVPANTAHSSLSLISKLNHLEMSFQRTLDTLRSLNDRFFNFLKPNVYSAREIQDSLLRPQTALIEFIVGEKITTVIVVARDTISSYDVRISEHNLKQLMSRISRVLTEGKSRIPIMNAAIADFDLDALRSAFQLLIKPALPFVKKADHLTIVSDGVLLNFPFELMVTGRNRNISASQSRDPAFLIEEFEINYALSASQALMARNTVHRPLKTMLAIGDAITLPPLNETSGYSENEHGSALPRKYSPSFPGVRRELAAIKRIFGARADILTQAEATPLAFKADESDYRIIHIAAHVEFDESRPLYSLIQLSPDRSSPHAAGLRAINFLSMELNAELVVLSGCNTGRVSSGTDLSGMTSSIVLSGVPTVVASLWNVDDEVTAQLMESFYSYLAAGHPKGESLRLAKLDMMRGGRSDPFYWGAFVLCGDGGGIALDGEDMHTRSASSGVYALVGSLMILLCSVVLFNKYKKVWRDL